MRRSCPTCAAESICPLLRELANRVEPSTYERCAPKGIFSSRAVMALVLSSDTTTSTSVCGVPLTEERVMVLLAIACMLRHKANINPIYCILFCLYSALAQVMAAIAAVMRLWRVVSLREVMCAAHRLLRLCRHHLPQGHHLAGRHHLSHYARLILREPICFFASSCHPHKVSRSTRPLATHLGAKCRYTRRRCG